MRCVLVLFISLIGSSLYGQELPFFEKLLALERSKQFPFCGKLNLSQNYPQPFSSQETSVINYRALDVLTAEIVIHDHLGDIVSLHSLKPGVGEFHITPGQLTPGVYTYALIVNKRKVFKKKLTVFK